MNKAAKACLEEGCKLAAEEWLGSSAKTGKELEALWSIYYACEEAHKSIAKCKAPASKVKVTMYPAEKIIENKFGK